MNWVIRRRAVIAKSQNALICHVRWDLAFPIRDLVDGETTLLRYSIKYFPGQLNSANLDKGSEQSEPYALAMETIYRATDSLWIHSRFIYPQSDITIWFRVWVTRTIYIAPHKVFKADSNNLTCCELCNNSSKSIHLRILATFLHGLKFNPLVCPLLYRVLDKVCLFLQVC